MAIVKHNKIDNLCFDDSRGIINIEQISFSNDIESNNFREYDIVWSGDIDPGVILSNDKRTIRNLKNGSYTFIINSLVTNNQLGPFNINITSPPKLTIVGVQTKESSCLNDGYIYIEVSGGVSPYLYSVNGLTESSVLNNNTIIDLPPGKYSISVTDSNGCSVEYPSQAVISNSSFDLFGYTTIAPTILDNYGIIKLQINGSGPFSMIFEDNLDVGNKIYINALQTEYISKIENDTYFYEIADLLLPGSYTLTIENSKECIFIEEDITIPNTNPMSVQLAVQPNNQITHYIPTPTLPIYDTILIPYDHIAKNSNLWQYIKTLKIKDNILIQIDGQVSEFLIVRNMLDKYSINSNQIEVLTLGNKSSDWFFYFYVAPGLNPDIEQSLLNATLNIVDSQTQEVFPLKLGLDDSGNLDTINASIIRGSFILADIGHNQFINSDIGEVVVGRMDNTYVSIGDNTGNEESYNFITKNTKKYIYKNLYQSNFVTILSFLEKFQILNQYVNTNNTLPSNINISDYQYILNIKQLLKEINNINNLLDIYIYNLDNVENTGSIKLFPSGNDTFTLPDESLLQNKYLIEYFTTDSSTDKLYSLMINNNSANDFSLEGLKDGYYIVKIKDSFNNKCRSISFNNLVINYDNHFLQAKQLLQDYNILLVNKFEYGDILIFISNAKLENNIPQENIPQPFVYESQINDIPITPIYDTIKQTNDTTETGQLSINVAHLIKHWIYGPNNYVESFSKNTLFINLVPGVYTIIGDDKELMDNYLYQNEYRILIETNSINSIDIDFNSYENQVITVDNN